MTTTKGCAPARSSRVRALAGMLAAGALLVVLGAPRVTAGLAGAMSGTPKPTAAKRAPALATTALHYAVAPPVAADPAIASVDASGPTDGLTFSDEYERAELLEKMLAECRGIAYNAYELAQTSGESLWLPAPIQLMVVRVRHPYCAGLVRAYAPKLAV